MLPKAIMLDLDDTIISFDAGIETAWADVCNEYCKRENSIEVSKLLDAINEYRKWYWSDKERHREGRSNMAGARRHIVTEAFTRLGLSNLQHAFEIADDYSRKRLEELELFPKALETLDRLKENGIRLALITNGDSYCQRYKIDKFKLDKYFDVVLVEGELGFGKPDKRVYENALSALGLPAKDTWMAGDNLEWDVGAPQELGIFSIWVDFKKRGLPMNSVVVPDRIVNSICELLD